MIPVYQLQRGESPLLVSLPHAGTQLPDEIALRLAPGARTLPDTDWHVDQLYDFLDDLGASSLCANYSRYLVDLNRLPDGSSLYPGQSVTEICPTTLFSGGPLYANGAEPDTAEIQQRVAQYWHPYHDALQQELARIRDVHGYALLWDAHSIASRVPRFFEGSLPDLNIGTADDSSCAAGIADAVEQVALGQGEFSSVRNGRFKGGAITRLYGEPERGVHAVQLELSQATYMEEQSPYRFDEERAQRIRPLLRQCLEAMLDAAQDLYAA